MSYKVAFQGEVGAYSEQAIYHYFSQAVAVPYAAFEDILTAVKTGAADYAMLPVENTLGGTVLPACMALMATTLAPIAEVILPIHHMLMVPEETTEIQQALSHPQALAQCRDTLQKLHIKPEAFYDTAGAAAYVARHRPKATAAIASALAAQHYQLKIIREHVEDQPFNQTRFLVIAPHAMAYDARQHYKTSLTFTLSNEPGALAKVLTAFAQQGINLTKIESHPTRQSAWEYWFFADVLGHAQAAELKSALAVITPLTLSLRLLGSYATHSPLAEDCKAVSQASPKNR